MCARTRKVKAWAWVPVAGLAALAALLAGCFGNGQGIGTPLAGPSAATRSPTADRDSPTPSSSPRATSSSTPRPPTPTIPSPSPSPTATALPPTLPALPSGTVREPITDPDQPRLIVHKSGVMCLEGPGADFPVVQFFLPYYGFPFYFDPQGERTIEHEYPVTARHFNSQGSGRGWWWKIDRGAEGVACWVKQPPDLAEGGQFPYLVWVTLSGDLNSVPTE